MKVLDVVCGLVVLVILLFFYFKHVYSYWKRRRVIGPKPVPFFGNTKESALRRKHVAVLFKQIYNEFPNEKVVGFYRMTSPALLIRDLDIIKQILIKDFETFPDRGVEFSKEGLGDSLFHCDSITWKALRSHLTPLFTSERLKYSVNLMTNECDKFIQHVENVCLKHKEQEMVQLIQKYTMASIFASFFGISANTIEDSTGVFDQMDESIFKIQRVSEIEFLLPGILKKMNLSIFNKTTVRFCYKIVEAVKLLKGDPTVINDLMDILLALQRKGEVQSPKKADNAEQVLLKMTDHVLASQVLIFFAAGYANNTYILSYALYHLAKNPEIQKKLIAEIDEVLKRFEGQVTYESIKEMTYLDQVFSETLRLHSTANSLQRCAARNYVIPGTDVVIQKGVTVTISAMAIHHDPNIYPDPNKFDPERFAPELVKTRHSCAYLPFGIGPRSCIAIRFAKVQFKVCAVKLLSKFWMETSRRTKDEYLINPERTLLGPTGGIHLNIIPRLS
ncbi:cytochrome P450 6B4 [Manduca sexta]|uniref:unspecific monooxygenase n=1 Tax=Manduca sexta TaxID=7130 RepID=A0A921Z9K0_MANSE|nr:cytochrome P450 6B4 [Manduca sexta]KAG6453024.1 hypothetical protein O3G_MSEX007939 [Manduca sexta]KAG6453025.1 hypothetical protein O3G_MSEX007939 [Manduca sexta]